MGLMSDSHHGPGDMGDESEAAPGRGREADCGEHPQLLLPVSGRLVRVVCLRKPAVAKATNTGQVLQLTHSGMIVEIDLFNPNSRR